MASNLAGLAANIEGSIAALAESVGISGIFGKKLSGVGVYPENFPSSKEILSNIKSENWTKSLPYTFSVVDDVGDASKTQSAIMGFTDFALPINPSELSQDETISVKLTPTQGGTVINRSPVRYGDLVISGTTGVHPNRGAGGASKKTGKAIFQPDELKYKSGFEVFLRLRNWFKAFYQVKATNPNAKNARLVFKNFKDGEFLIVELTKFSLKRSAGRPFLYDYGLTFRVIGRAAFKASEGAGGFFNDIDNVINTAQEALDQARGVFLRSQDILRQVESAYENTVVEPLRKATLACKAFTGIGTTAADMSKQAISNTVSSAAALAVALGIKNQQAQALISGDVDPRIASAKLPSNVQKAIESQGSGLILNLSRQSDVLMAVDASEFPEETMLALAEEQSSALDLPRSFFEDAIAEITRMRDNAADKFNLGDPLYNEVFDRVVSSKADPTKLITDREFELLAGFEKALEGLNMLLSTNALFRAPYEQRIENIKNGFDDRLPSVTALPAVKQIVMPANTDLERLALQQLGDPGRWVEIAEVNDLKPPYVVQSLSDTSPNTVRPGEKILIPQPLIEGFGSTPTTKERYINEDLNAIERNLGIDFKITDDFDLALGNRGDLEVVRGADNAAQAVILKLSYEKGELLEHPELGVGLQVGTKGPQVSEIQTSLLQTLTADPRFESVENLEILRKNNALSLDFILRVKNVDTPIPVSLKL